MYQDSWHRIKFDVSAIRGRRNRNRPLLCGPTDRELGEGDPICGMNNPRPGLYPGQGGGRGHLLLQRESLEGAAISTCAKHSSRKHVIKSNVAIAKLCC